MFSTVSRHKGKRRHALLHKRRWISLEGLRKFFLNHTVVSPSYYDSQRSFSLYHCSSWPAQHFLPALPGFEATIPAPCRALDACWCRQHLHTSLWFAKYLYLTWNLMQNKIAKCGDPAIFTNHSITEPIFTVRQEYNNYNNGDKGITDPTGFKEVREYLKKVQVIRDAIDAQKQGAADVAAALADVKPKVRVLISSPDLIFNLSLRTYTSSPSALARLSNPRPLSMTRTTMKSKLSEVTWMSLWVRPMDPLLPCPVLIPCVSQLIIQVSLLHSTTHFLSWPSTTFSTAKLKSRPPPRTKARNVPWPRSAMRPQRTILILRLPMLIINFLDCPQTCWNGQYSLCRCPRHGY